MREFTYPNGVIQHRTSGFPFQVQNGTRISAKVGTGWTYVGNVTDSGQFEPNDDYHIYIHGRKAAALQRLIHELGDL